MTRNPQYQPTAYQYTDPQGREFLMTADGVLRSIKDLHGNIVTFNSTGITSSAGGLNVPFQRDSSGRITQITDPAGNAWRYEYDEAGNLSHVRVLVQFQLAFSLAPRLQPGGSSVLKLHQYPWHT